MKEKNTYSFLQIDIIRSSATNIFSGKITLDDPDEDQVELLIQIMDFK